MTTTTEHIGLDLDQVTNDLHLDENGHVAMATAARAVGQHARQRLKTFEGEWFLDRSAGVMWLDRILGKQQNPALAEAVIKAEILDTPGVREITSFSVGFVNGRRELRIRDVAILTTYDEEVQI